MADLDRLCFGCMKVKPDYSDECPYCKYDGSQDNATGLLPIRTKLQKRYVIGRSISQNGEGITYLGFDLFSSQAVRIRELYTYDIADRDNLVVAAKIGNETIFARYKQEFIALAKGLHRMNGCSGLLDIIDIFEENGTVYYISQSVEAIPLHDFLIRNGGSLTYEQTRPLIIPLLSTLSSLHAVDIIHGGISPETIIIGKDGVLRLTDFCISDVRKARSDLQPQLYKGYAAIEQYGFDGEQGPWTDVYAIAACCYRVLVGTSVPEATARVTNDKMTIPSSVAQSVPKGVLSALADALEIMPNERTRSIDEFKSQLVSGGVRSKGDNKEKSSKKAIIISVCIGVIVLIIAGIALTKSGILGGKTEEESTTTAAPTTTVEVIDADADIAPQFIGVNYSEILSSSAYLKIRAKYEIVVSSKEFSDQTAGTVLSQTPKAGKSIKAGETIKIVVSLGPEKVIVPNVVGLTQQEAYIKLLEAGFKPQNISFGQKFDENATPQAVVDISPNIGESVSVDMKITVNINSFTTTATTTTTTTTTSTTTTTKVVEENTTEEPVETTTVTKKK